MPKVTEKKEQELLIKWERRLKKKKKKKTNSKVTYYLGEVGPLLELIRLTQAFYFSLNV